MVCCSTSWQSSEACPKKAEKSFPFQLLAMICCGVRPMLVINRLSLVCSPTAESTGTKYVMEAVINANPEKAVTLVTTRQRLVLGTKSPTPRVESVKPA